MLLRLSIQRVARGIGRALGQLQLEITFDGVQFFSLIFAQILMKFYPDFATNSRKE